MPARTVRIGVWEALLPPALGLAQAGLVIGWVFGVIPWPVGIGLWIAMLVAFVTFEWIRSARQKASLQPGEWLELEEPSWIPGSRAYGLFFLGTMLALFVVLVIATIAIAVGE
jgi:hypothetical protein